MRQATSNEVVDLVSEFLTKILSNDPNSSKYLNEWSSFKPMLSSPAFDFSNCFSYIQNINKHPTLDVTMPGKPKFPSIEVHKQPTRGSFDLGYGGDFDANGSFEALNHLKINDDKSKARRHSYFDVTGVTGVNPLELGKTNSHKPSRFAEATSSLLGQNSDEKKYMNILGTTDMMSDLTRDESSATLSFSSPTRKGREQWHYQESDRKIKLNIFEHTQKLTAKGISAQITNSYALEERSPLRRMKVYEKLAEGTNHNDFLSKYTDMGSFNTGLLGQLDPSYQVKLY